MLNPLFGATERAEEDLLLCPDLITNETQVVPILEHSKSGELFYVLELKGEQADTNIAAGKKRKLTPTFSPEAVPRRKRAQPQE